MLRVKLSVVCALCLSALAIIVSGCSSNPVDKTAGMSATQLYAEAREQMDAGLWDKAIPVLEKLEARAAGTTLAQQAQIDRAYAHYKAAEPAHALAALERFIKLNPASPVLDYALYLKGLVNFNDDLGLLSSIAKQDLAERDQKAAKESFDAFKELVTRFPESRYTPDAQQRMNYVVGALARYEVYVARYYFKRGAYLAALNRAQLAVADYREVPAIEEALFIIYKCYDALEMPTLRDDAKRVLEKSFPQSTFLAKDASPASDKWWKIW